MTAVFTGTTIALHQGETYRARARVDSPKALTPTSAIVHGFEDEGFSDVHVYTSAADLPADWPTDQRTELAGGALGGWTVFLEATWNLPDEVRERPEPILAVWVAHPSDAAAASSPAPATSPPSSEGNVYTLPEVVIVGEVRPSGGDWRGRAFLVGTGVAVAWMVLSGRW